MLSTHKRLATIKDTHKYDWDHHKNSDDRIRQKHNWLKAKRVKNILISRCD